ncbi:MAG: EamA family transporter, partial [Candidatus Heimdallarchaeota archaeon]|nr:EamA family transporter [Candidatus Heimdallarchaeota archaeon]
PLIGFTRGFGKLKLSMTNFDRRDWLAVIFVSFGGSALGLFFFLISFSLGNPTIAILLQKSQPLITLIFAFFILKERPTKFFYLALAIALVGIGLIATPSIITSIETPGAEGYEGLIAILCSLVAATLWGGSTVFGRILTKKVDFWDLTLIRYIGGFLFLIFLNAALLTYDKEYFSMLGSKVNVFGYFNPDAGGFVPLDWQWPVIVCILFFALFTGGVLPLSLYYFGLKRSKASIAGLAELAFPLLAIFVNYYFLGFGLKTLEWVGAIVLFVPIVAMSYINALGKEKKPPKLTQGQNSVSSQNNVE